MKYFIAAIGVVLMLVVGTALGVVVLQDVTGIAAWLSAELPHNSLALLVILSLAGLGYSTAAGLLYYQQAMKRDDTTSFVRIVVFGLMGLALAYVSRAVLPSMFDSPLPGPVLLIALIQMVMGVASIFLPGIVAGACLLALPINNAAEALFAWARKTPAKRKKQPFSGTLIHRFASLMGRT